ncbi:hypothetical protein HYW94_03125 [Candidatus Uhrbacteria bacterium]|nr:hypothetical protein [Candidatus Uhrbacteria bacterium]
MARKKMTTVAALLDVKATLEAQLEAPSAPKKGVTVNVTVDPVKVEEEAPKLPAFTQYPEAPIIGVPRKKWGAEEWARKEFLGTKVELIMIAGALAANKKVLGEEFFEKASELLEEFNQKFRENGKVDRAALNELSRTCQDEISAAKEDIRIRAEESLARYNEYWESVQVVNMEESDNLNEKLSGLKATSRAKKLRYEANSAQRAADNLVRSGKGGKNNGNGKKGGKGK